MWNSLTLWHLMIDSNFVDFVWFKLRFLVVFKLISFKDTVDKKSAITKYQNCTTKIEMIRSLTWPFFPVEFRKFNEIWTVDTFLSFISLSFSQYPSFHIKHKWKQHTNINHLLNCNIESYFICNTMQGIILTLDHIL